MLCSSSICVRNCACLIYCYSRKALIIAIYCLHIKCSFSPSFSPEYNFNLEQQLTPERSEGVSSCSNLKLYEGLKEGEKEHLYASNT